MNTGTKQQLDLTVEPVSHEDHVRLEVSLEGDLIKSLIPVYKDSLATLKTHETSLTYALACLKAVRVGKGRDGEWSKYAEAKFTPLKLRTMDRWITGALEEKGSLPEWVVTRLTANKRKTARPTKIGMSLPLTFDNEMDRTLLQDAVTRFGFAKLTEIILEAVREEMGR